MASIPIGNNRGRPSDPQLNEVLLDAAIEVYQDKGFARGTMAAVAKKASASTASLYRRWPSKKAFLGALAKHLVEAEFGAFDTGSLSGDLQFILKRQRRVFQSRSGSAILSLLGEAAHDEDFRRILYETAFVATRDTLEGAISRALVRGEIVGVLSPEALHMLSLATLGGELLGPVFQPFVEDSLGSASRIQRDSEIVMSWLLAGEGLSRPSD